MHSRIDWTATCEVALSTELWAMPSDIRYGCARGNPTCYVRAMSRNRQVFASQTKPHIWFWSTYEARNADSGTTCPQTRMTIHHCEARGNGGSSGAGSRLSPSQGDTKRGPCDPTNVTWLRLSPYPEQRINAYCPKNHLSASVSTLPRRTTYFFLGDRYSSVAAEV